MVDMCDLENMAWWLIFEMKKHRKETNSEYTEEFRRGQIDCLLTIYRQIPRVMDIWHLLDYLEDKIKIHFNLNGVYEKGRFNSYYYARAHIFDTTIESDIQNTIALNHRPERIYKKK